MDIDLVSLEKWNEALKLLVEVHTMHHVILDLEGTEHKRVDQTDLEINMILIFLLDKLVEVNRVDVEIFKENLALLHHWT